MLIKLFKKKLGKYCSNFLLKNGLYCFNYHRIGDPNETDFDPNVYSCDESVFEEHLIFYKKNFQVITLEELKDLDSKMLTENKYALLTFDDGYEDNYSKAFKLLQQHQVPATFFLATDFVDKDVIPWWDEIAFLLRYTKETNIQLAGWSESVSIDQKNIKYSIRDVLRLIKSDANTSMNTKVAELKSKLNVLTEPSSKNLFMTWDNVRLMQTQGMSFGSQSCTHRIMSHLSKKEQIDEASISKSRITSEINKEPIAFAYPVGDINSFTLETISIISQYYPFGFSFISGVNKSLNTDIHALKRFSIDNNCTADELAYRLLKAVFFPAG